MSVSQYVMSVYQRYSRTSLYRISRDRGNLFDVSEIRYTCLGTAREAGRSLVQSSVHTNKNNDHTRTTTVPELILFKK